MKCPRRKASNSFPPLSTLLHQHHHHGSTDFSKTSSIKQSAIESWAIDSQKLLGVPLPLTLPREIVRPRKLVDWSHTVFPNTPCCVGLAELSTSVTPMSHWIWRSLFVPLARLLRSVLPTVAEGSVPLPSYSLLDPRMRQGPHLRRWPSWHLAVSASAVSAKVV